MGLFFNKSKPDSKATLQALDVATACAVLQNFPIGSSVRYYPEFKKNIQLDTVIIGYMINKIPLFSAQDIVCEDDGAAPRLLLRHEKKPSRVTSLSIIIPAENRGVGHLDYTRREELERTGGLTRGNNITLIAHMAQGKTPLIQTTVTKNTLFKEGPFANTPIAVLDVDVTSLLLTDQRAQQRIQVQVPAQIKIDNDAPLHCTLADFSNHSVRLRAAAGWPTNILAGCRLSLAFRLPGRDHDTVLHGKIYRVDYNDLVLMLEDIQRDGHCRRLEIIDVLELKSKLLQLPNGVT